MFPSSTRGETLDEAAGNAFNSEHGEVLVRPGWLQRRRVLVPSLTAARLVMSGGPGPTPTVKYIVPVWTVHLVPIKYWKLNRIE